jgi:predicted NACHT family NTPase
MARKYGKNETTLSNVLKLVKALLALADGEIDVPGDKLKATFNEDNGEIYVSGDELKATLKLLWKGKGKEKDELWVSGKVQQKRNNRTQTVEKGITKEDLWTLVEYLEEALELSPPKDEKNVDNAQRRSDAIQDVLDCLKDLGILFLEDSARNQGFWKFFLKLKHQTARKEENLKVIKEKWKIKFGSVTVETTRETIFISKDQPLNWQEICRQNLAEQKQLTTNPFTNAYGVTPQLDEIYVPLAIVERKPSKPPSRDRPEEKEEEKLIPIAEERFFEDVLRQGQSAISQGRKIAIIGEPGSGKTTRLQKIADWILEEDLGLPILVSLADLTQPTITQYIEDIWLKQTGQSLTIDALTQQKHLIWLLLDGLDEMTSKVEMRHVSALLGGWVQAARVVVTCRVNVWEADKNAFSGFDVFRNLEFNPEQVTDYIRRWFAEMKDAATGESLEAALVKSENSRLKELIQNPLRLWMLCQIGSSRKGTLPDTQAKLYASFIKYIYRWKEQFIKNYAKLCGKTQSQCQELLHQGLGELAKAAIDGKSSRFRLSYRLVSEYLGDRSEETSLLSLALSLGWLNRVGIDFDEPEEPVYAFYHATFQEYFAALAVEDWDYFLPRNHVNFPVVGKEYRIFAAQWKQVILLWLGLEDVNRNQKEEFIEALIGFEGGCHTFNTFDFYGYPAYFLAAAGIGEFKDCSRADEIVATIIKWGCGGFNLEKQEWETFPDPIAEAGRAALLQTNYSIAVNQLIDLLKTTEDEDTRQSVVECLDKIDPGNPEAIATLIAILSTTTHEDSRRSVAYSLGKIATANPEAIAALITSLSVTNDVFTLSLVVESLGKIDPGNSEAIAALIQLLSTTNNEYARCSAAYILGKIATGNPEAISALIGILSASSDERIRPSVAYCLGKIDPGNLKAIAALIQLLSTTNDEDTCPTAAECLDEIATGNPKAIADLIQLLSTTNDEDTHRRVAESLGKIDPGNPEAIAALIQLLSTTNDEDTRSRVAESLGKIATGNPEAIAALIQLLSTTNDEDTCSRVAESLGKIATGNPEAIAALIEILSATNGKKTCLIVVDSLGKIDPGNSKAIAALIELISLTNDKNTRWMSACILDEIVTGNPEAIAALIQLLSTTNYEDIRCMVAKSLGKIATGNPEAIAALMAILSTTTDEDTRREVAYSLGKIARGNPEAIAALIAIVLTTNDERPPGEVAYSLNKIVQNDQMPSVVSALQQFQCDTTYKTNFHLYESCFEIIWNCAQNLPYPTFYQAWHHQLTTPHPEVPETTGVGSTPFTQSLNLADLPKILEARLVATQLIDSVQLICIDTSKFIDPHNPAPDIYEHFLDQNCPERPNGEPETLPQLKSYWNQLRRHSHKPPILIFYEDPTSATARGFSPTFLDALTRFDGTICLITDTPHPPLQTFSPHDPDLLQTVVNWLKRLHLES